MARPLRVGLPGFLLVVWCACSTLQAQPLRSLPCSGEWTLGESPRSTDLHPWSIGDIAERCFQCTAELLSDDPQTPLTVIFRVQTDRGRAFDYRLFEFCQPGPTWASFRESVVFPPAAQRIVGVRVERGAGPGAVAVRNLRLVEQPLRFDHRVRPLVSVPADLGPLRPVRPQTAELFYRPGLAALCPQVAVPIYLSARSGLAPRTPATVHIALPDGFSEPFVIAQGHPDTHAGTPDSCGDVTLDGKPYRHYSMPTVLFYAQNDGQAVLYLKPRQAAGDLVKLAYWVEWEGGRQPAQWLEAEVLDLPAGPQPERFPVALSVAYPWVLPRVPDFGELLRRTGIGAVEIGDIVGYTDQRKATFDFLRAEGIMAIGSFSPGWWYPYQAALAKDPEMQAQGVDGKPVPTDHGPAACPSYRGPLYQQQMDLMRVFARYGLDHVSFDEEFFGPGPKICFCPRCRKLWEQYAAAHDLAADVAMERFTQEPAGYPELYKAWVQFKADLMTEWYRDYRAALSGELAKSGRADGLRMYATSQTGACGAGETELLYIMRDNDARLRQGVIQGLLPMPYFYQDYYGGSLRKVGEDLIELQKLWSGATQGRPSLFPYLLTGGAGMCYVEPQRGLKYQLYEAFTTGAVSGAALWYAKGMDAYHYRYLGEALHALARVEDVLWEGQMQVLKCAPEGAAARAVVKGDQAAVMVSHYGYEPVDVTVQWPARRASVVEDAETGKTVATLARGAQSFPVQIDRERVRLLHIRPR